MKFREHKVDGFFTIHTADTGDTLTAHIMRKLDDLGAVMIDVQYSTHIEKSEITDAYNASIGAVGLHAACVLVNDVLVMYQKIRHDQEAA